MAWRIDESNCAAVAGDGVRTNVLRDPACLALGDAAVADRIEQGSFAVVNMAHNNNDRRTFDQLIGAVLFLGEQNRRSSIET